MVTAQLPAPRSYAPGNASSHQVQIVLEALQPEGSADRLVAAAPWRLWRIGTAVIAQRAAFGLQGEAAATTQSEEVHAKLIISPSEHGLIAA